jgi:hypothetical protein
MFKIPLHYLPNASIDEDTIEADAFITLDKQMTWQNKANIPSMLKEAMPHLLFDVTIVLLQLQL